MGPKQAPYVICYLCGRKYGTKSINIHEPHCLKRWHDENAKLPKHLRRKNPPPRPDYNLLESGNFNDDIMDRMNEQSFQAAQAQLIPCVNCGRTFLPDRLQVHQRSCTSDKPARPKTVTKSRTINPPLQQSKPSSSQSNDNIRHGASDATKSIEVPNRNRVQRAGKSDSSKSVNCIICNCAFSIENIQHHVLQCNENSKTSPNKKNVNDKENFPNDSSNQENQNEEIERPATRTLRRGPPDKSVSDSTVDKNGGNSHLTSYANGDIVDSEVNDDAVHLEECFICERKFAAERLSKHQSICRKTTAKKRKTFDSSKQRVTEDSSNIRKPKNENSPPKPQSNWRQTHEDFIRSIRAAKQVTKHMAEGGKASDLPPPPPSLNPDYVHCQYCDRRFNPTVAERHIPKCANTINRPAPPKVKALDAYKKSNTRGSSRPKEPVRNRESHLVGSYDSGRGSYDIGMENDRPMSTKLARSKLKSTSLRPDSRNQNNSRNGFVTPKLQQSRYSNYQNENRLSLSRSGNRSFHNDPYRPKTFQGINSKTPPSRGYSYNAANYTGPNFFG